MRLRRWCLALGATLACRSGAPADTPQTPPDAGAGAILVRGVQANAIHEHGGDPAHLDRATFEVENPKAVPARGAVSALWFLRDASCDGHAKTRQKALVVKDVLLGNGRPSSPASVVFLPGKTTMIVWFDPVDATYASCDAFGFELEMIVDGVSVRASADTLVGRVDPSRPR